MQIKENVGRLAQHVPTFSVNDSGKVIHAHFEKDQDNEGVVVMDGETPVGIIMRQDFYQKIGKQYGFSIYMNRPITLLMKENVMKVEADTEVAEISLLAMNRNNEHLYDFIIVIDNGKYIGIVSIKYFLIDLAKKREEDFALLRDMTNSIKNLMDNADQGFLSINSQFAISDQYSRECVDIFSQEISGSNLMTLLDPYINDDQREVYNSVVETILGEDNTIDERIYISLLPKEIIINEKYISFDYKLIDDSSGRALMLILTNITDKKELEKQMFEERNHLRLIVKAVTNQSDLLASIEGLKEFFRNTAGEIIKNGADKAAVLSEIFRTVHTFKGDLGHLRMMNASKQLHELEDKLAIMVASVESTSLSDIEQLFIGVDPEAILEKDIAIITNTLGEDYLQASEAITVSLESLNALEQRIKDILPADEQQKILPEIRKLKCTDFKEVLADFDESVQNIALRLEKGVDALEITGEPVLIDKNQYGSYIRSLMHIFRNAVDHGIEAPDERVDNGKSEFGHIVCEVKPLDVQRFMVVIRDDGKGVDVERVKEKALQKGIITSDQLNTINEAHAIDLIFRDDFSTKDTVSMLSGRGVGLSAVRSELHKLGGSIMVKTEFGAGTEFIMEVPLLS